MLGLILLYNQSLLSRLFFETYNDIFLHTNDSDNFNIFSIGHTYYYITSLNMFYDNMIIGVGTNLYREICSYPQYIISDQINNCSTHPHNFYLQLLAETGFLGFFFLFALFIYLSKVILKFVFKFQHLENYKYCLLLSIFINIFPISSHGNFFNNWISIIIFLPIPFFLKEFNLMTFKK